MKFPAELHLLRWRMGRLAVVGGGAAAVNTLFFYSFFFSFSSTPFPLHLSTLKISNTLTQTPRSKNKVWKEKKLLYLLWVWMAWCWYWWCMHGSVDVCDLATNCFWLCMVEIGFECLWHSYGFESVDGEGFELLLWLVIVARFCRVVLMRVWSNEEKNCVGDDDFYCIGFWFNDGYMNFWLWICTILFFFFVCRYYL